MLMWQNIYAANSLDGRTTGGFLSGTKVLSNDGESFYDVDELMSGWFLQSFNADSSENNEKRVVETFSHYTDSIYTLNFRNISEQINLSFDQVVLVKRPYDEFEWIRAENLENDDLVVSKNGVVIIENTTKRLDSQAGELVWNIELNSQHTFYVGEEAQILVHNAVFLIPVVTWVIGSEVVIASAATIATAAAVYLAEDAVEKHQKDNHVCQQRKAELREIDYIARDEGIDRNEFREWVHQEKDNDNRGGKDNYGRCELRDLAKDYKNNRNKDRRKKNKKNRR